MSGVIGKRKRSGRGDVDGKSSRPRHGTSPSDRQRRSRHISPSPQPAGVTRGVEKVIENDSERNHGRGSDRRMQREKGSDRETDSEKEWREGQEKTVLIIGLQEQDMGDLLLHWIGTTRTDKDLFHLNKLPIPELVMRCLVISTPSNVSSPSPIILLPDDENDAVAMMKAAEEALEAKQKEKPSFELSGKLAAETNRVRGITLLFTEPPDGRKPDVRWRLYNPCTYIGKAVTSLGGKEGWQTSLQITHPVASNMLLYNSGKLKSSNLMDTAIEPQRYYELMEKDTIRFGNSRQLER
ncbi:hypothetical protein GBA52_014068 [Prunus armeniaca]|nr:hypothetical protein GBA52_014068 [Prunus armeniaca]